MMEEYPYFLPPENLFEKDRREWNVREARKYMEWLLSVINTRTDYLKKRLAVKDEENVENILLSMGEKLVVLLNTDEFSDEKSNIESFEIKGHELVVENPGRVLNTRGKSIAIDMGLLVARFLMENYGDKLFWEIQRKGKREISFNLPVIRGFKTKWEYLEPVRIGSAYAHAILRGSQKAECWKLLYIECVNDLPD